jgi:hypothetical protein
VHQVPSGKIHLGGSMDTGFVWKLLFNIKSQIANNLTTNEAGEILQKISCNFLSRFAKLKTIKIYLMQLATDYK